MSTKLFIFDSIESPVPTPEKLEALGALRQAIIATPEFTAWQTHLSEERLKAAATVASGEAARAMSDYIEFIELEHQASRPQIVITGPFEALESEAFNPS